MKIYQLIYTFASHSLSDSELGLKNRAGLGVYSCSQGLSADNINEIKRFCSYHLPENTDLNDVESFPTIFRTFKLSDGKTCALSSVYAGEQYGSKPGNFFTHVLVVDENDSIVPERYYRSKTFKKSLTSEEAERELVTYLPVLDSADSGRNLLKNIEKFISEHKRELSLLIGMLMEVLGEGEKKHLVVAAENADTVDMYIISLKYLLPKAISTSFGISTYNIYMPSNAQDKIILHGTIKGKNNITEESILNHTNCIYADMDIIGAGEIYYPMLDKKLKELYADYELNDIKTISDFYSYISDCDDNVAEISDKLSGVKRRLGDEVFRNQCIDIFDNIDDEKYDSVRFEILDIMVSNLPIFETRRDEIIKKYIEYGIRSICSGNSVNIEKVFREDIGEALLSEICANTGEYMSIISEGNVDKKNGMLILRILSMLKALSDKKYWKEFLSGEGELKTFVDICAQVIINDTSPVTFTAPQVWTKTELSEVIAYFDSSISDEAVKNGCRKYILSNTDEEWSKMGILLKTIKKKASDSEVDIIRIRQLLSQVGYMPFSKRSYGDIKQQVTEEINTNDNPLMVARLLGMIYSWQSLEGQINESRTAAEKIYDLIMELKEMELSCYNYIFPKLALEILNSPGQYHEVMINADTMVPEFWNWFLISYYRIRGDEDKRATYQRVYEASSRYLKNVPIKERLDGIMIKTDN